MALAVEYIIKSGGAKPPITNFDSTELELFDQTWEWINARFNYNSDMKMLFGNPKLKKAILYLAQAYKKKMGLSFEGPIPDSGFGMQPIHQFDVIGENLTTPAAGLDNWYVSWTAGDSNYWNSWLYDKAEAIGTTAFGGTSVKDIVPRDDNNDKWAVCMIGFEQLSSTSVVKAVRATQNKIPVGDFDVESQFLNSEYGIADIGMVLHFDVDKPFGLATHTITKGTDAVRPLGVTFGTALRFLQPAATYRNRCKPTS